MFTVFLIMAALPGRSNSVVRRKFKEDVTLLLCANMDNSEKPFALIIGKSKHLCVFHKDLRKSSTDQQKLTKCTHDW